MIANPRPDPRLAIDPRALGLREPARAFFRRDTIRVARELVGAWIARRWRGRWYGGAARRDRGVPGADRPRGAFLWRAANGAHRADVRRRRAPLRLPRLRHAPLRQRRHAPRGRRGSGAAAGGGGARRARRRGCSRAPASSARGLGITRAAQRPGPSRRRRPDLRPGSRRRAASASPRASASTTPATPGLAAALLRRDRPYLGPPSPTLSRRGEGIQRHSPCSSRRG